MSNVVNGNETTYPCGCMNAVAIGPPLITILKSIFKCGYHLEHAGAGGLNHYIRMGALVNGVPRHQHYINELREALPKLESQLRDINEGNSTSSTAIEIGCGLGMYAPFFMNLRYQYFGVDTDADARAFVASNFDVDVYPSMEECPIRVHDVIMAAHVLEHIPESPIIVLKKWFNALHKNGRIVIIIPDDEDPVNPDHLWFFTEKCLRDILAHVGFVEVETAVRRRVKHENFIYATARKP